MRSMAGMLGFVALTFSIAYLPMSILNIILNTAPFAVSILSYFLLNETLKKRELIGMVISFVGVLVLIQTKMDTNEKSFDKFYLLGIFLALF